MNELEAKEISDVQSLTTQLNAANAIIATHTQNINALFSEDLSFSTDFTELTDSLNAQITKEYSDVAGINERLDGHDGRLNTLSSSLQLTNESLSEQIAKQASESMTALTTFDGILNTVQALTTKEANDVEMLET